MNTTEHYDFQLYEPNDSPSLIDGYNKALISVDKALHELQNDVTLLTQRVRNLEVKEG